MYLCLNRVEEEEVVEVVAVEDHYQHKGGEITQIGEALQEGFFKKP
jgi:hypothetical protein